jgi:hypothetical protein
VNRTTPLLLSSTSFSKLVFWPSFVSTSPPNPFSVMVSPTAGAEPALALVGAAAAAAAAAGLGAGLSASFSFTAAFAFEASALGPPFFLEARSG